ncbi:hypothetical protein PHLCEN_2v11824 [Hermanssonia centrifuga]|uniref:Uncharacterized protein n=1 Tax=Hermanssonia centrifuga TaxID=98765 RepID=A0A2R6NJQ7_9APHY|nr:hypothetical protein PHLCEN_2v11824 [Hermanssonia centrifuga]
MCLPPELVLNVAYQLLTLNLRKRVSAAHSLVSRTWATIIRPAIFETLSLRCIEDLQFLQSLADTPTSVVKDYVKHLFLAPRMRCTPWLHLVATLASSLPHCRNIEVFYFAPLTLHGLALRSFSSVHALLPRALPSTYSNFRKLSLNNHHFRAFSELLRLVGGIPALEELVCWDVAWPSPPLREPQAQALVRFVPQPLLIVIDRPREHCDYIPSMRLFTSDRRLPPASLKNEGHFICPRVINADLSVVHELTALWLPSKNLAEDKPKFAFEYTWVPADASASQSCELISTFSCLVSNLVPQGQITVQLLSRSPVMHVQYYFSPRSGCATLCKVSVSILVAKKEDLEDLSSPASFWERVDQLCSPLPCLEQVTVVVVEQLEWDTRETLEDAVSRMASKLRIRMQELQRVGKLVINLRLVTNELVVVKDVSPGTFLVIADVPDID